MTKQDEPELHSNCTKCGTDYGGEELSQLLCEWCQIEELQEQLEEAKKAHAAETEAWTQAVCAALCSDDPPAGPEEARKQIEAHVKSAMFQAARARTSGLQDLVEEEQRKVEHLEACLWGAEPYFDYEQSRFDINFDLARGRRLWAENRDHLEGPKHPWPRYQTPDLGVLAEAKRAQELAMADSAANGYHGVYTRRTPAGGVEVWAEIPQNPTSYRCYGEGATELEAWLDAGRKLSKAKEAQL